MVGDDAGASLSRLPAHFGKYSILGHLATGGMADVYIARQAGLEGFEKIVVIKSVKAELVADTATTSLFLDEARLVATLEHPNIAQVYEIGIVNNAYFFVMEYVHGADLRQVLQTAVRNSSKVALEDAVYIIAHVCAALHYAHEKTDLDGNPLDIIHRDVSPSNVLLSHDGAVKVCDFGVAKATTRTTETGRGVLKGKLAYMSPEQCKSEPLDRRSDIFSIGILLYELSTASRLFEGASDFELMRAIIERPVAPPSARVAGYPAELERIALRALAKDPADRYATAQAMQLELEDFAREHKLKMSSVSIARLMGQLFEKSQGLWTRAVEDGKGLEQHLLETAVHGSDDNLPVFMPVGSDLVEIEADRGATEHAKPAARNRVSQRQLEQLEELERARSRPSALWLAGAVLCGLVAAGVTLAGGMMTSGSTRDARRTIENDAERIGAALDAATRTARERADAIAATPMLRSAIETDAATLRDLAANEYTFPLRKGETAEIFQVRDGKTTTLLRMPADAGAIALPPSASPRIDTDGKIITVLASAPIAATKSGVSGVVAVAAPVDLAGAKRALGDHALGASLVGLARDVQLVAPRAGQASEPVKLPIASTGEWSETLALVATPVVLTDDSVSWIAPARYASLALAGLLVLVYAFGLRRAARA
jgi:serine/threonine protein kinase